MSESSMSPSVFTAIRTLNYILTPLSLICTIFMVNGCRVIRPRSLGIRFIAALAISDFFYSFAQMLSFFGLEENRIVCAIEGSIRYFFFTLAVYWASSISVLYFRLNRQSLNFNKSWFFKRTMIIGFILSSLLTLGPLYSSNVTFSQNDGNSCYLTYSELARSDNGMRSAIFILFKALPIITGLAVSIFFFIYAYFRNNVTRDISNESPEDQLVHGLTPLLFWYPLTMFLTLLPICLLTLIKFVFPNTQVPGWYQAMSIGLTYAIGLTNSIAYAIQIRAHRRKQKRTSAMMMESEISQYLKWNDAPRSSIEAI